jgi:hypothetical protein
MELTIKCLFKDYHKMVFPYPRKAYFNDLKFGDLIDNQNHYIHIIGSWITPRPHVLFEISKDIINYKPPTFGRCVALLLDSKSLQNNIWPGTFARYISA